MRIQTAAGSVTVQARKCALSPTVNTAIRTCVGWAMAVRMAVLDSVRLLNEVSGVHVILKHFLRARSALADAPTTRLVVKV